MIKIEPTERCAEQDVAETVPVVEEGFDCTLDHAHNKLDLLVDQEFGLKVNLGVL